MYSTKLKAVFLGGLGLLFLYTNCSQSLSTTEDQFSVSTTCSAPAGVSNEPGTVDEVVRLINALPKPVTVPCFVQALKRPLYMYASQSSSSAQPSTGTDSPRMFIFSKRLILTIAPAGMGKHLLEMGQLRSDEESIKAELAFPISSTISNSLPYGRIDSGTSTTCGACHRNEYPLASPAGAYASRALRASSFSRVAVSEVKNKALSCNALADPYRCAMLTAVFGHGEVIEQDFPLGMPDF
jgi:hypothetical protein